MPIIRESFAICRRCFADELSGERPAFTSRLALHDAIWIQESHVTAHRLVQEDDHTILTGCGRRYSTESDALLVAGSPVAP